MNHLFLQSKLLRSLILALLGSAHTWAAPSTTLSVNESKLANTVILDPIAASNLGIQTVSVEEQTFHETIFALGRIDVRPGFSAVLSSRIAGRAREVSALPDHNVTKGEPLVVVESRQPGDPPPSVTLTAPISGIISEIIIEPGEPVSPEKPLLRIVDLSSVYGIARVPESLASKLRNGLEAMVRVPGWPEEVWRTQVEHVGAVADAGSGTLEAAFHIPNSDLKLRPGMRAEFSIVIGTRENVMAVPRSALQGGLAQRFVFVADETIPHAFQKVPVEIGAMNEQFVEIVLGLFPSDQVVTEGAYSLAFAGSGTVSLKEALDAAHGHEHNPDGSEIDPRQAGAKTATQPGASDSKISRLTLFSLATNAVLLLLLFALVLSSRRRRTSSSDASTRE